MNDGLCIIRFFFLKKEYVENYEENENMEGMNQEEYDEENMNENGEEEAGLDVYAFDI